MTNETTNAGPVLPPIPSNPEFGRGWMLNQAKAIEAYGRQCAEHVAGPLRERVAELEQYEEMVILRCGELETFDEYRNAMLREGAELDRLRAENEAKDAVIADSRRLAAEIGQALDGAGSATAPSLCDLIEPVRKLRMQHDMLRAESTIEWEPGRSYTAAELLRRAIRGLRVRKDSDLWPAVRNMCGVGSGVAHFVCRWAGRDPDTGAELKEPK